MTPAAMTSAEFRIAREALGVSGEWLAAELDVTERTLRRWETGTTRVPAGVAADMTKIQAATDRFVAQIVEQLAHDNADDEAPWWVLTYASDAAYRAEWPELTWPAGWHRAAMGRVMQRLPQVRVHFLGDQEDD